MSNEKKIIIKKAGRLVYIGDEILPSYVVIISYYKDPGSLNNQYDSWKVSGTPVFFRGSKYELLTVSSGD